MITKMTMFIAWPSVDKIDDDETWASLNLVIMMIAMITMIMAIAMITAWRSLAHTSHSTQQGGVRSASDEYPRRSNTIVN